MESLRLFFDAIQNWPWAGQFIIICLVGIAGIGLCAQLAHYVVILVRGWPPAAHSHRPISGWCDDTQDGSHDDTETERGIDRRQ